MRGSIPIAGAVMTALTAGFDAAFAATLPSMQFPTLKLRAPVFVGIGA